VRQLGPLAFDNRAHFVGDLIDALDLAHVFVEPFKIGLQHDLAADDAGLIDSALFGHWPLTATNQPKPKADHKAAAAVMAAGVSIPPVIPSTTLRSDFPASWIMRREGDGFWSWARIV